MGSVLVRALLVGSLVSASACAARQAQPKHGGAAAQPSTPERVHSRYREMSWAEYYAEVTERVWKRGGMVVWINPPHVRSVKQDDAPAEPQ